MPRVKKGVTAHRRHKKILKLAKGAYSGRRKLFQNANETVKRGLVYAFRDRKAKKRDFRRQWIVRITAACEQCGVKYSRFINALTKQGIEVNRKMLSELAIADMPAFKALVEQVMAAK